MTLVHSHNLFVTYFDLPLESIERLKTQKVGVVFCCYALCRSDAFYSSKNGHSWTENQANQIKTKIDKKSIVCHMWEPVVVDKSTSSFSQLIQPERALPRAQAPYTPKPQLSPLGIYRFYDKQRLSVEEPSAQETNTLKDKDALLWFPSLVAWHSNASVKTRSSTNRACRVRSRMNVMNGALFTPKIS